MESVIQNGSTAIPTANVMELCEVGSIREYIDGEIAIVLGRIEGLRPADPHDPSQPNPTNGIVAEIWALKNQVDAIRDTAYKRLSEAEANIRAFYDETRNISLRLYHYEQTKKGKSCPRKKPKSKPSKRRR